MASSYTTIDPDTTMLNTTYKIFYVVIMTGYQRVSDETKDRLREYLGKKYPGWSMLASKGHKMSFQLTFDQAIQEILKEVGF